MQDSTTTSDWAPSNKQTIGGSLSKSILAFIHATSADMIAAYDVSPDGEAMIKLLVEEYGFTYHTADWKGVTYVNAYKAFVRDSRNETRFMVTVTSQKRVSWKIQDWWLPN